MQELLDACDICKKSDTLLQTINVKHETNTDCNAFFHQECIKKHLKISELCPICNQKLVTKKETHTKYKLSCNCPNIKKICNYRNIHKLIWIMILMVYPIILLIVNSFNFIWNPRDIFLIPFGLFIGGCHIVLYLTLRDESYNKYESYLIIPAILMKVLFLWIYHNNWLYSSNLSDALYFFLFSGATFIIEIIVTIVVITLVTFVLTILKKIYNFIINNFVVVTHNNEIDCVQQI
jgi:hypothetical protein